MNDKLVEIYMFQVYEQDSMKYCQFQEKIWVSIEFLPKHVEKITMLGINQRHIIILKYQKTHTVQFDAAYF